MNGRVDNIDCGNWRDELDEQSRAAYEEWLNAEAIRWYWFGDPDAGRLFEPDGPDEA